MILTPLLVVPFALPALLGLLGFGAVGVVAGGWAALWQAHFGIGVMFSVLQGLAMGGGGAISVAVSGLAGVAGVTYFCDTMHASGACAIFDSVPKESINALIQRGFSALNATRAIFG
jgi:hypothetical protein